MFGGHWHKSVCPIGLDLGAHRVRMLQLDRREEGPVVRAAASRPLPEGLPTEGPPRVAALAALLREMHRGGGFVGRHVVSCLPAAAVQYKNLRIPRTPPEELRAAVEWEAADRLGLSPDAHQVEFYDAGEVRQGEDVRQEIILLAAARPVIDEHVQLLLAAGLDPRAIDAVPGALARGLEPVGGGDAEGPAQVVLDVGYASSKVLITRRGKVIFFKLIEIGGARFDEKIAQHLSLPPAEAAELRRRLQSAAAGPASAPATEGSGLPGLPAATAAAPAAPAPAPLFGAARRESVERAVFEALRSAAGDLAKELALCLRYYGVTFRGGRPEALSLVGGEAGDPQLARVLAEGAGIRVEPGSPLAVVDLAHSPALASAGGAPHEWIVAAGLSLRPDAPIAQRGAA